MDIVTLGIDLAKNMFALAGLDAAGKVVLQRPTVIEHSAIRSHSVRRRGSGRHHGPATPLGRCCGSAATQLPAPSVVAGIRPCPYSFNGCCCAQFFPAPQASVNSIFGPTSEAIRPLSYGMALAVSCSVCFGVRRTVVFATQQAVGA